MFQGSKHGPKKKKKLGLLNNWIFTKKKKKIVNIYLALIPFPKICLKWITNLKVKHKTMIFRKQLWGKLDKNMVK